MVFECASTELLLHAWTYVIGTLPTCEEPSLDSRYEGQACAGFRPHDNNHEKVLLGNGQGSWLLLYSACSYLDVCLNKIGELKQNFMIVLLLLFL